jgi:hypothetical protein
MALALVVAIVWLAADLFPVLRAERHLSIASNALSTDPMRAFQSLQKAAAVENLSRRQKERLQATAREIVGRVRGRNGPVLKQVGPRVYDAAAPARQYVSPNREIVLTFCLPAGFHERGMRLRVSSAGRPLAEVRMSEDGTTGRADVPLELGATVIADVDLVVPLGFCGAIVEPIARNLKLTQNSQGPQLVVRAGAQVTELRDGDVLRLQVDRGTPIKLEVADDLGLGKLQWRVDGVAHDPFEWSGETEARVKTAELPAELTAAAAGARELEFNASNSHATPTRATVQLCVREPRDPPIARAQIEHSEVRDGSVVHASERVLTLSVRLAKGELADDLVVLWDDRPQKTQPGGEEVAAQLSTDVEGPKMLVLKMRNVPALHCTIVFDWTPPTIGAILDPGGVGRDLEVRRPVHEVPTGSIVQFAVSDPMGIDRELTECRLVEGTGLEEVPEPEGAPGAASTKSWTKSFRCEQAGEARVRLVGADTAGNRTTIHEFRIRTADPMQGRAVALNGQPLTGGAIHYTRETAFKVTTEGGIDLDGMTFLVLDPDRKDVPLGQTTLVRGDRADSKTGSIDLGGARPSGSRVLAVLSRGGRELAKYEVVIDFAPPTFQVHDLEPAGTQGDVPRFFATGGQNVSLTLTDDVGIDVGTVGARSGAHFVNVGPSGKEVAVVLRLPSVLDEPVVLVATDVARNQREIRFEVVSKEHPASRPDRTPEPEPEGRSEERGDSRPETGPSYEEVAGNPRIVHPALGIFHLVPVKSGPAFYAAEREVSVRDWRAFLKDLQGRAGAREEQVRAVSQVLNRNLHVWTKSDDEPLSGTTPDLARAYRAWANEIAPEHGTWAIPTAAQWRLAAGRASHPEALYPITAAHQNGGDLSGTAPGGALFGRQDRIKFHEAPQPVYQQGAYGLRAMPGSLYEWVRDPRGQQLMLIGGSAFSPKAACLLDAPLRAAYEITEDQRGLRLILLPKGRR